MAAGTNNQSPHSQYFFNFEDDAGESQFLLFHHLRHHKYDLLMSQAGQTLPPLDISAKVDKDWLFRHSTRHRTLRRIAGIAPTESIVGLNTVHWNSRTEVTDWLRIHALDHKNLDAYFGLI